MNDFNRVDIEFRKMLQKDPDKFFLQFSITAGHGMCYEGGQCILLNEFSARDGFLKMFAVEKTIRSWSENNSNCYFIALFASCREVFRWNFHCDCIAANSLEEAKQKFKATKEEQEKKRILSPPSKEEEIVLLKERNAKLEAYLVEENVM